MTRSFLLIITFLSFSGLINALELSQTGCCGRENGLTCAGTTFGRCCSRDGRCGSTPAHCGLGCQPGFGSCGGGSNYSPAVSFSSSALPSSSTKPGYQDGSNRGGPRQPIKFGYHGALSASTQPSREASKAAYMPSSSTPVAPNLTFAKSYGHPDASCMPATSTIMVHDDCPNSAYTITTTTLQSLVCPQASTLTVTESASAKLMTITESTSAVAPSNVFITRTETISLSGAVVTLSPSAVITTTTQTQVETVILTETAHSTQIATQTEIQTQRITETSTAVESITQTLRETAIETSILSFTETTSETATSVVTQVSTITQVSTVSEISTSIITQVSTTESVATSTISVASCPTGNPVLNGGFESSLLGTWSILPAGDASLDRISAASDTGTYALRARIATTNTNLPQRVIQAITVCPGANYRVSFNARKTTTAGNVAAVLYINDIALAGGTITSTVFQAAPAIGAGVFSTTSNSVILRLEFSYSGSTGTAKEVQVDDVVLTRL